MLGYTSIDQQQLQGMICSSILIAKFEWCYDADWTWLNVLDRLNSKAKAKWYGLVSYTVIDQGIDLVFRSFWEPVMKSLILCMVLSNLGTWPWFLIDSRYRFVIGFLGWFDKIK